MLFYQTAIGIPHSDRPADRPENLFDSSWETVMRGHAIANDIFLTAVSRVGVKDIKNIYSLVFKLIVILRL
ncbi:hypothetical protein [Bacillus massiliigorillae]|uniref:hypothetical protein n=1 Tax=Bacillus massiliigorillae TaxID=1243664 RepID=UPI0003A45CBB|nr:hypothetical protein [Bacillus massiliigorillae]